MQFIVVGSNSSGNSYILRSDTQESLLIECGVSYKKILQALDFKINNVSCIVSHSHGDHCNSIASVLKAGIPVYASKHTLDSKGVLEHHRTNVMTEHGTYKIGQFTVKTFPVNHDVPCFGFMIKHPEMGLAIFLTDSFYSDFIFPAANHYIVECNHEVDIMLNNNTKKFLVERIVQSHMNLDTCAEMLLANDLSQVNNIVLIHLSDTNSDAKKFKRVITGRTGKTVTIAEPGVTIHNFNLQPF